MEFWWKNRNPKNKKELIIRIITTALIVILAIIFLMLFFSLSTLFLISALISTLIFFPLLQRHGRNMLEKERVIAISQFKNDMKVKINTRKVFFGYFEMFIVCWLILILAFLPPWPHAWAILFFPVVILYFSQIVAYAPTWEDFGYKMHRYYLLHLVISVLCIVLSLTIKTIFIPIE